MDAQWTHVTDEATRSHCVVKHSPSTLIAVGAD